MKKILMMCALLFGLFSCVAFATVPFPEPQQGENLTEIFDLANTDKIIIRYKEFSNEITDKTDINKILNGFSKLSAILPNNLSQMEN